MEQKAVHIGGGLTYNPSDETFLYWDNDEVFSFFPKKEVAFIKTIDSSLPEKRGVYSKYPKKPIVPKRTKYQIGFFTKKSILLVSVTFKTQDEFRNCITNLLNSNIRFFNSNNIKVDIARIND